MTSLSRPILCCIRSGLIFIDVPQCHRWPRHRGTATQSEKLDADHTDGLKSIAVSLQSRPKLTPLLSSLLRASVAASANCSIWHLIQCFQIDPSRTNSVQRSCLTLPMFDRCFGRMAGYNAHRLRKDLLAGLIVGIVALPLAMAFAIASGVPPERGLYTAIIAGAAISIFGGSRVQIGGPTGAMVAILSLILLQYGLNNLLLAGFVAG